MRKLDWNDPDWGNHVTFAANGSWVLDHHDATEAVQS